VIEKGALARPQTLTKGKVDARLSALILVPVFDYVGRIAGSCHTFHVGADHVASGEDPDPTS
jgi:hypothetical protein